MRTGKGIKVIKISYKYHRRKSFYESRIPWNKGVPSFPSQISVNRIETRLKYLIWKLKKRKIPDKGNRSLNRREIFWQFFLFLGQLFLLLRTVFPSRKVTKTGFQSVSIMQKTCFALEADCADQVYPSPEGIFRQMSP